LLDKVELRKRVEALLLKGELYFPTAIQLNDPFEAAPHFRIPDGSPEEVLATLAQPLREIYGPRWGWSKEQIAAREKEMFDEIVSGQFQIRMEGVAHKWRERFRSDYPMCCMSANRDSTLMWSYYADGHTGLCVHFDATTAPFANASRVDYSNEYPQIPIPIAGLEPEVLLRLALLTKSAVWSHEQEYRLINMWLTYTHPPKRLLADMFTWKEKQIAVIPASFIIGVTVGASMADSEIEEIQRICHDRPLKIPVYQAQTGKTRFDLNFRQIA